MFRFDGSGRPVSGFVGIGAQKCASTWIYDILSDHPEVVLSNVKELDFFSNFWDRGHQWYRDQFDKERAGSAKIVGEVSPLYFYDADSPERIRLFDPRMKLVVTFRNPVDRAFSNHKHNIHHGFSSKADITFENGLCDNPSYFEFGLYGKYLKNWLEVFPKEQIHVVFFDDIVKDPVAVAQGVYRFLKIDPSHHSLYLNQKSNESVAVSSVKVAKIMDMLRTYVRNSPFHWLWSFLKIVGFKAIYRKMNFRKVDVVIPKMRSETKSDLILKYTRDINLLESLTGRDLSEWLR